MTERRQLSLFARTTLMILGGGVMTLLVYVLLMALGRWGVNTFYLADAAVEARNRALSESLQQFVSARGVQSTDYAAIEAWFSDGRDADLILYEDDSIVEAGVWGYERLPAADFTDTDAAEQGYTTFTIRFANGARRVAIADCSDLELIGFVQTGCAFLSFAVFLLTLLLYTRRISRGIRAFSGDVSAVSDGVIEHVEERRGFTELSGLAHDVNHMHDVIAERTHSAWDARKANSDLITALSHDLRNPLTSLIGYLDLLSMESDTLTETQRQYLTASVDKADRIRVLTDEMFRYFLIFSDEKPHVETECFDAQILLEQLLGEYAIELEAQGYTIRSEALQTPCRVIADVQMLHRVLENLLSNVLKYADPDAPVVLEGFAEEGQLHVRISNAIRAAREDQVESNHVGLRTCAAILELLDGTFRAEQEQATFVVEFTLPLLAGDEAQPAYY